MGPAQGTGVKGAIQGSEIGVVALGFAGDGVHVAGKEVDYGRPPSGGHGKTTIQAVDRLCLERVNSRYARTHCANNKGQFYTWFLGGPQQYPENGQVLMMDECNNVGPLRQPVPW